MAKDESRKETRMREHPPGNRMTETVSEARIIHLLIPECSVPRLLVDARDWLGLDFLYTMSFRIYLQSSLTLDVHAITSE